MAVSMEEVYNYKIIKKYVSHISVIIDTAL